MTAARHATRALAYAISIGGEAAGRVRNAFWPITLTAVAAALAWLVAHRGLGHPAPFFAPIAAAVSLSTSRIQRFRQIVQLVGGVLLGIGIAELFSSAIGVSTVSLGVVVFVTVAIAVAGGAGFFAGGMMFANQAAASAILVVTLHKHGTGGERAIDALVGGGVSLVLGVLLFPAHPIALLREPSGRCWRSWRRLSSKPSRWYVGYLTWGPNGPWSAVLQFMRAWRS